MRSGHRKSVTDEVIFEVASALARDPIELEPLAHVIDTDALNRIDQPGRVEINFEYEGFRVTVRDVTNINLTPI